MAGKAEQEHRMCEGLVILAFSILLTTSRLFRWLVFLAVILLVTFAFNIPDNASSAPTGDFSGVPPSNEPYQLTKPCESNSKLNCLNIQTSAPFRADLRKVCSGIVTVIDIYWYDIGHECPFYASDASGKKILSSCHVGGYCKVNALVRRKREDTYIEQVFSITNHS